MRYFKVMRGFGENDFIPIEESELEKAVYAQIVGNIVATFANGSIMGNHISAVLPDFHRAMGWNYGHKIGVDDHSELNRSGVANRYAGVVGIAKERVNYFMTTNQRHLIGTGAPASAASVRNLDEGGGGGSFAGAVADLANKKKIS